MRSMLARQSLAQQPCFLGEAGGGALRCGWRPGSPQSIAQFVVRLELRCRGRRCRSRWGKGIGDLVFTQGGRRFEIELADDFVLPQSAGQIHHQQAEIQGAVTEPLEIHLGVLTQISRPSLGKPGSAPRAPAGNPIS